MFTSVLWKDQQCSVQQQTVADRHILLQGDLFWRLADRSCCHTEPVLHNSFILRGYKTLVNYCLKCCPKTQRRSHTLSVWAASDVMGLQVKPVIIHFWAASWFIYLAFFFFFASLNDRLWVQSLKIQHLQDVVLWWLVQHKCYEKQIIYTEPLQL